MWDIINARKEAEFTSFEDIKERVTMLADPVKLIAKRVHLELEAGEDRKGKMKYILFTRPPKPKRPK
jgi:putative nucleotide binding protein